jgi:hypothetical protein
MWEKTSRKGKGGSSVKGKKPDAVAVDDKANVIDLKVDGGVEMEVDVNHR